MRVPFSTLQKAFAVQKLSLKMFSVLLTLFTLKWVFIIVFSCVFIFSIILFGGMNVLSNCSLLRDFQISLIIVPVSSTTVCSKAMV